MEELGSHLGLRKRPLSPALWLCLWGVLLWGAGGADEAAGEAERLRLGQRLEEALQRETGIPLRPLLAQRGGFLSARLRVVSLQCFSFCQCR